MGSEIVIVQYLKYLRKNDVWNSVTVFINIFWNVLNNKFIVCLTNSSFLPLDMIKLRLVILDCTTIKLFIYHTKHATLHHSIGFSIFVLLGRTDTVKIIWWLFQLSMVQEDLVRFVSKLFNFHKWWFQSPWSVVRDKWCDPKRSTMDTPCFSNCKPTQDSPLSWKNSLVVGNSPPPLLYTGDLGTGYDNPYPANTESD